MNKFDHRIHLICAPADAEAVRAALEKTLPGWLTWAPVGEVDPRTQEIAAVRCWIDSGQWTAEQAAQITAACAGLPVRVVRGVALGLVEAGAVAVDVGDPAPRNEAQARRTVERTIERAVEEGEAEQGEQITKEQVR